MILIVIRRMSILGGQVPTLMTVSLCAVILNDGAQFELVG